mmetsp:Transcript_5546/g.16342  ORF Transcript_5546/g.16342 Transcript_5546/m.16342 type:complete len:83 (-) Transcript_5546:120-368(-)
MMRRVAEVEVDIGCLERMPLASGNCEYVASCWLGETMLNLQWAPCIELLLGQIPLVLSAYITSLVISAYIYIDGTRKIMQCT